jgi:hypothetical protein
MIRVRIASRFWFSRFLFFILHKTKLGYIYWMEKPIKHLYFEVLEYLANEGIEVDTNIKKLCSKYVNKSREEETLMDALDAFSKSWGRVTAELSSLERSGYIKYSTEYGDLQQLYVVGGNFSASITQKGLDYYYADAIRQATLKSLRREKNNNITTWIIAIASAVGTIVMGIWTANENRGLEQRIFRLERLCKKPEISTANSYHIHINPDTNNIPKKLPKQKKP